MSNAASRIDDPAEIANTHVVPMTWRFAERA